MTFDQLVVFETVIKTGSFKAAAEKLHKTQPALSVAIRKLEEELQTPLFDRSGYRPVLSDEGKIFYERARSTLEQMRSLQRFGVELAYGTESEIRVGVEGISPIPQLLCHFRDFFAKYSETSLNLSVDYLSGTIEKLLQGELDFGFTPIFTQFQNIEAIPICEVRMVPVVSPKLLKEYGNAKALFSEIPQVVIPDTGKRESLEAGVLKESRRWRVSDMSIMKEIIKQGLGWGALPEHMIHSELKRKQLAEIREHPMGPQSVKIFIARNQDEPMGPIGKKLWIEIQRIYKASGN